MRSTLLFAVVVIIATAPFADGEVYMHDWRLFPSVVAPSIMMMLVFAIPLDITMARIFMEDADEAERARLRFIIKLEVAAYLLMLAAWVPFFITVLQVSPFD